MKIRSCYKSGRLCFWFGWFLRFLSKSSRRWSIGTNVTSENTEKISIRRKMSIGTTHNYREINRLFCIAWEAPVNQRTHWVSMNFFSLRCILTINGYGKAFSTELMWQSCQREYISRVHLLVRFCCWYFCKQWPGDKNIEGSHLKGEYMFNHYEISKSHNILMNQQAKLDCKRIDM